MQKARVPTQGVTLYPRPGHSAPPPSHLFPGGAHGPLRSWQALEAEQETRSERRHGG